ncbi:MAG: hypothetical protein WD009_03980 [Phycisphaeraceae bacterium]
MQLQAPQKVAPASDAPATTSASLRAIILLAGTPRASALVAGVQRSPVDLPLDNQRLLLDLWIEHCRQLARHLPGSPLHVRVLVNANTPAPRPRDLLAGDQPDLHVTIEHETASFRGSGGAVRDAAQHYDDNDRILVASAGQVLVQPLATLFHALEQSSADVAVLAHRDGTPGGLTYLRCGCVRDLAPRGFVDLKEQALPRLARRHDVRVVQDAGGTVLPVRTRADYLAALRWYHRQSDAHAAADAIKIESPFAEDWQRTFAVVEPDAVVDPTAWIHDSVVLAGGRVEAGASVVRCVIGPGGRVARRGRAVDEIVTADTNGRHRG